MTTQQTPLPITDEDRALIKPYVILPMILRAFERDSRVFLKLRTPAPYIDWLYAARERLSVETRLTRFEAVGRGIKVYEEARTDSGLVVRYLCRGYHGEAALMRKYLTFEISE